MRRVRERSKRVWSDWEEVGEVREEQRSGRKEWVSPERRVKIRYIVKRFVEGSFGW